MSSLSARFGMVAGTLITIAVMLAFLAPPITAEKMEGVLVDYRYFIRGDVQPPASVVLITIDDASIERIGQWPWKSATFARLVDGLRMAGARTIMSDVLLLGGTSDDTALAEAIQRHGGVFLPVAFDMNRQVATLMDDILPAHSLGRFDPEDHFRESGIVEAVGVFTPTRELLASMRGTGHINSLFDAGGAVRREPALIEYEGYLYPPLSMVAAAHALGADAKLDLTSDGIHITDDITVPLDRNGTFPINYYGGARTFASFSAADVIDQTIPTGVLKNKLVIIGTTARSLASFRTTPYSKAMPAYEKHAHIAASIMADDIIAPAHPAVNLLIIAITGVAATLMIAGRRWWMMALYAAVLGIAVFFVGQVLFLQGTMVSLAFPMASVGLVFIANVGIMLFVHDRFAGRGRGLFAGAVEQAVLEELAAHPETDPTSPRLAMVTVLYAVIHDFSARAETEAPEDTMMQLNEYLEELSLSVTKWQGTVARGNSREVVAFWGAPVVDAAKEEAAIRCALSMRARIERLNERWVHDDRKPFSVGIGIATGRALTGMVGAATPRPWYTVVGRIADDAGLLASACKKLSAKILFTGQTLTPLRKQIEEGTLYRMEVRGIGRAPMPGFAEPVPLYEVHGLEHGEKSRIIEPGQWKELSVTG